MKEHIYTIPINEAFDTNCECPVCYFMNMEEAKKIEYTLGASMMEPDERLAYNKTGFCRNHTRMMYDYGNRLSHALILETRTQYLTECIDKYVEKLLKCKKSPFFKSKSDDFNFPEGETLAETSESCIICNRLDKIERDFISNILHLYKKESGFKEKFDNSKGFCIKHFKKLIDEAISSHKFEECKEFLIKLSQLEKTNLQRLNEEVNWFTKKFDYRYKDEDWKNSKDSVQRACLKTSGHISE